MASRFSLPHIDIARFRQSQTYLGSGSGGSGAARIRAEHGRRVQNELQAALQIADLNRPTDERIKKIEGIFVEVELRRGTKPDVLDQKSKGIRSGAVKQVAQNIEVVEGPDDPPNLTVALFVPDAARETLEKILEDYVSGPLTPTAQKPLNMKKVEAIQAFRQARLETFWTDSPNALPHDPHLEMWWGLWCAKGHEEAVELACARLDIRIAGNDHRQKFPETTIIPIFAKRAAVELLLFATGGIAELRRASDTPVFFIEDARDEQHGWVENLAERTVWPGSNAPSVCILDTGVNRAHALIEPALSTTDSHTINNAWGSDDHDRSGHGTAMAGMTLHGDLTVALSDTAERVLNHRVETVKILAPNGFDPTEPRSYGPITQAAVALPEIAAPYRSRTYCMAVTNDNVSGAIPSAWSAAVDQVAAGTMVGDDETAPKRLFVVSCGNVPAHIEYSLIRSQNEYPVEDPAQAWNALTVGGFTDLTNIQDAGYDGWSAMAKAGDLSPHSRTSEGWPKNSPFKPEVVMEAGNRTVNPAHTEVHTTDSLSLLSTGRDAATPLVSFQATSAATAQAARLAARIAADHAEFWPETIRGLIVHSAEWTPHMAGLFANARLADNRYGLVRRFGYGVPDYDRATASAKNHLALFAQSEIQPFRSEGGRKFGDCHYYDLPIPRQLLEQLENEPVELKITLSYFIDPNPGLSANIDPQRYQSHGLRFDLRRKNETPQLFKQRVNASERLDPRRGPKNEPDDGRWLLGPNSISAGSLHCDVWRGPAIELIGRDTLCIKPVVGWNRERASKAICNTRRRYSLIVSLKAHNAEIDLYTPISTAIGIPVEVGVTV